MAAIIAQLDASSTSYRCTYDVFLSYRGEDTRKGFTDHLYRELELAGIHTFRDDDGIDRGANIASELQKAIQESRASIIVFSKDYASSRWCLDELVKIMKRRKTDCRHMVMPVFYDVDPSHVRKQTGTFAQAFARHEERFKEEMDKVMEWRRALRDVADVGGMVLGDMYESQFIQNIVEEIGNKLDHCATEMIAPYVVGIDKRVQGINMWLKDRSNDVSVAVIYGMGGIGKTTIAKAAYNQNFHRFQGCSYLADVRATSEQPNGLAFLQRKLLSDIQKGKKKKVYSMGERMSKIKHAVCCKTVLIVLDDVDQSDQFNAILGRREWFHPGSKIIVTTRHESLLNDHEVYAMFKVRGLGEYESLELFSWHAFKQVRPVKDYIKLTRSVVQHCQGLPLALQVLGSSLVGRSVEVWESALQKLNVIPNEKIQKILRISFDSLQDDHDRSLFLHIVSFFVGKKIDYTITVLDNLHFYTRIGIQNLVDRCLVDIDEDNKLVMHQLLIDMGRGIIREESPEDPGKRSIVLQNDASDILRKLTQGTKTIKGLMLNLPGKTMFNTSNKKRYHVDDYHEKVSRRRLGFFSWKSITFLPTNSASESNEVDFKTEAFTRMHNLELLLLNNVIISGGYKDFPKNLKWISWRVFPLKSIPADLYLENLVGLDLRNSRLHHLWQGPRVIPRLKFLNVSHSHGLVRTPNFSGVPNIEKLVLKDCTNLVLVDESIADLEKLIVLNLKDCKNLPKLPTRLSMMTSLQELILSGCSKLVFRPNAAAGVWKKLNISTAKLSQSMWLWRLWILLRKHLVTARSLSAANWPNGLVSLSLADCNLPEIPSGLSILSSLKHLNLSRNPILSLPENLNDLITLQTLVIEGCTMVRTLPELPPSLRKLHASYCTSLEKITNLPNMFRSLDSSFWKCKNLVEVQSLFNIKPLRRVDIEMIRDMGLFNLESVGTTEVEMTNYLTRTRRKGPIQGLYECGIFSAFLHGNKIPDRFPYRSLGNSTLSIIVPSHLNLKVRGLNACVVYSRCPFWFSSSNFLKVSNETKGLKWTYCPVRAGLPRKNHDMLWLSHWLFGNDELEGGDEVRFSMNEEYSFWTKEFGIQLVYEQENEGKGVQSKSEDMTFQPNTTLSSPVFVAGNVSASASKYQLWTGKFFLCNHRSRIHQLHFRSQERPDYLGFSYLFKEDVPAKTMVPSTPMNVTPIPFTWT
ncbi:disease resistance protein RPV1-like isoform X1 [Malus domestica]|uniref:disease resistance protein RPV1-like isoform X1 n=1 Tax=Malus domestica TaxID=3750 RepID=UPI003975D4DF